MPTYGLYLSTLVHEFSGIYVRKLSNHVIVCGYGSFGKQILLNLKNENIEHIAIIDN